MQGLPYPTGLVLSPAQDGLYVALTALFADMAPILATRPRAHWMAVPVPGEDLSLTGLPLSFNGERPQFAHGAPRLGADNAAFGVSTDVLSTR